MQLAAERWAKRVATTVPIHSTELVLETMAAFASAGDDDVTVSTWLNNEIENYFEIGVTVQGRGWSAFVEVSRAESRCVTDVLRMEAFLPPSKENAVKWLEAA
jgi:hypothetical protein